MNKKSNSQNGILIVIFCVVAVALKVYFLLQRGYEMDIGSFLDWSGKVADKGFWSLYSAGYQSGLDYPPLIPFITAYWQKLRIILPDELRLFKLMTTSAELIFSAITAVFVYRSDNKYKMWLLAFVIIQPALGVITSAWGQVDSILSLFIICSFVLFEKNLYLSSFFLFLAFLTKPQSALAVFVFFLVVLFRKGLLNFLKQGAFWLVLLSIMTLLFKSHGSDFLSVYLMSAGRYPHPSMNAFNFWWLLFGEQSHTISDSLGNYISYKTFGLILFGGFLIPAVLYLYKKAKDLPDYFLALTYIYVLFFIFPTQIHERYIFPALAVMPFAAIKDKKLFFVYIGLSITLFLNNYAILQYAYPQFPFWSFLSPDSWVGEWTRWVAVVNVAIALYLAYYLTHEVIKNR